MAVNLGNTMIENERDTWLTAQEVATEMRVHVSTVVRMCKKGTIPNLRFGGVYRIRRSDLAAYIEAQMKREQTQ